MLSLVFTKHLMLLIHPWMLACGFQRNASEGSLQDSRGDPSSFRPIQRGCCHDGPLASLAGMTGVRLRSRLLVEWTLRPASLDGPTGPCLDALRLLRRAKELQCLIQHLLLVELARQKRLEETSFALVSRAISSS